MLPTFEAPAWVMKILIALLVLGFPIALGFLVGLRDHSRRNQEASRKSRRSSRSPLIPDGTYRPNDHGGGHRSRPLRLSNVASEKPAQRECRGRCELPTQTRWEASSFPYNQSSPTGISHSSEAATVSDKSIAVLPFDNLSDDKSNAYFAEGIQDEILTRLSKIAALKVISRSSTKKYQSVTREFARRGAASLE